MTRKHATHRDASLRRQQNWLVGKLKLMIVVVLVLSLVAWLAQRKQKSLTPGSMDSTSLGAIDSDVGTVQSTTMPRFEFYPLPEEDS